MNFENMNTWCWLIPVIVGVICGILGYLIGKGSTGAEDTSTEIKSLQTKNNKLQADLDACHKRAAETGKIEKSATTSSATATSFTGGVATGSITFNAAAAKAVFGKKIKQDDLKVIEGIGPKIEGMFKDSGIKTWKALSEASVADCQKVLDKGGKRYRIHDPASWPMQAKMCYEGKWPDLMKWQEEHKHGKL
jgi:predicted flap endonuclease-1-like 5' DNA nuclease